MEKKRLLIFHPTIAPYRVDFFNDLYEAFDTKVCLQYRNLKSQKFDYNKISSQFKYEPKYLPESSRRSLLKAVKAEMVSFQPNIVLTCEFNVITIFALMWRCITGKQYKVVVMCDDSYDMVARGNEFSARHRIARNLLSHFIDNVIVVNPQVQKWFFEKYKKGIYFPIIKDEEKARRIYRESLYLRQSVIEQYQLEEKTIFLFVGRLVAIKNVNTLIRAFAALDQSRNSMVVVGGGPEEENLKSLVKEKNANVIFTGRLEGEALNVWYTIADCFVLASYQEAFGAVTNEALLAGCRCLVSKNAGSCCLIKNGVNGYTFNPNSENELCNFMVEMSQMPKLQEENGLRPNQMIVSYKDYIGRLISDIYGL